MRYYSHIVSTKPSNVTMPNKAILYRPEDETITETIEEDTKTQSEYVDLQDDAFGKPID